jgi:hypothetical protein
MSETEAAAADPTIREKSSVGSGKDRANTEISGVRKTLARGRNARQRSF